MGNFAICKVTNDAIGFQMWFCEDAKIVDISKRASRNEIIFSAKIFDAIIDTSDALIPNTDIASPIARLLLPMEWMGVKWTSSVTIARENPGKPLSIPI
jgi:hypothetical protein